MYHFLLKESTVLCLLSQAWVSEVLEITKLLRLHFWAQTLIELKCSYLSSKHQLSSAVMVILII